MAFTKEFFLKGKSGFRAFFLCVLTTLLLMLNLLCGKAFTAESLKPVKRLLLLFPYQVDMPHTQLAAGAIRGRLSLETDLNIELYSEYMDINRFSDKSYKDQLKNLYISKYGSNPNQKDIDLVLLANRQSLEFWLSLGDQILPGKPVVFYDISARDLELKTLAPNMTGVLAGEKSRYIEAVECLLRMKPSIRELVLVYGTGPSDRTYLGSIVQLRRDLEKYPPDRLKITDWSSLSLSQIEQRAADLPPTSAILFHLMFQDIDGTKYRPIDVMRRLAKASPVPVLGGYDQMIGTGTIGGYMYSIEKNADTAAEMGLRILRGEKASAIPVEVGFKNCFVFDHPVLQRFEIPISSLPQGAVVKNRQYSIWEMYRNQIIGIIASFIVLLLFIALLVHLNRGLTIAKADLKQLNANLEIKVQERTAELSHANSELREALTTIKHMEGILPICSVCKKIRSEDNSWQSMETYISNHTDAQFSHSFCSDCARKLYPEMFDESGEL